MLGRPPGGHSRRGRDGHRPHAPDVGVTEIVRQGLDVISQEVIVVPQHVVVGRPRRVLVGGGVGREGREHNAYCIRGTQCCTRVMLQF